ncbi:arylalkylamine N-acetyltransferase-like 7 isoform X2 [Leptinotarsa decemlineata]|uniref:arylalkylamine N-acetyltransferase-like 7 isoform X2 n=1 Tax=Leptinotarsa decemlineata TaxID=7539 RepID=UPI003D30B753
MSASYPTNFFEVNEVLEKVSGLRILDKESRFVIRVLQLFYVFLIYCTGISLTFSEYVTLFESLKDIGKLASYLLVVLTNIAAFIKFFLLVLGRSRLQKLMNTLQDDKYRYSAIGESNPGLLVTKEKKLICIISYSMLIMYTFVGILANTTTVMNLEMGLKANTFEFTNKTCNDFMLYDLYVPFTTDTKWKCIAAATFFNAGFEVIAFIHATHDALLISILCFLKTQFKIIGDVLRTIRQRSLRNINLPEDYSIHHDEDNPLLEEELYRQLKLYTEHLKMLLRMRDEIEYMFTYVLLIQILASLFTYASCLYFAFAESVMTPDFFSQLEFCSCVLVQLSCMCWFGNEIKDAGEAIIFSLYEMDWFSCSPRFKKSMILTMIRMQRPIYLSIGKFSPLTLATLVTVCRASFSYFTVFKSV